MSVSDENDDANLERPHDVRTSEHLAFTTEASSAFKELWFRGGLHIHTMRNKTLVMASTLQLDGDLIVWADPAALEDPSIAQEHNNQIQEKLALIHAFNEELRERLGWFARRISVAIGMFSIAILGSVESINERVNFGEPETLLPAMGFYLFLFSWSYNTFNLSKTKYLAWIATIDQSIRRALLKTLGLVFYLIGIRSWIHDTVIPTLQRQLLHRISPDFRDDRDDDLSLVQRADA